MKHDFERTGAEVIGTHVDAIDWADCLERIRVWAAHGESRAVVHCNVHSLVTARHEPTFARAVRAADLVTPDGAVRQVADGPRPCRISLTDAAPGGRCLLDLQSPGFVVHRPEVVGEELIPDRYRQALQRLRRGRTRVRRLGHSPLRPSRAALDEQKERLSEIARSMVMDYGMSRLGRVTYRSADYADYAD